MPFSGEAVATVIIKAIAHTITWTFARAFAARHQPGLAVPVEPETTRAYAAMDAGRLGTPDSGWRVRCVRH